MSDKNLARRTKAQVFFGGVDVTDDISKRLISISYTDKEGDATDDLQIRIEDRDNLWLTKWLSPAIYAAANIDTDAINDTSIYYVTSSSGVNVRSGPGDSYNILGTLPYKTTVTVEKTSGDWSAIVFKRSSILTYTNGTAWVMTKNLARGSGSSVAGESGELNGLVIQAVFSRLNWNGDGKDGILDCGAFYLDSVSPAGPPETITIKASSLPYTAPIRKTKHTQAWEAYYLSDIIGEMATRNNMAYMYLAAGKPYYNRVEQINMSDISFLNELCGRAGLLLKVTNNIIVIYDKAEYESSSAVRTIKRGDGTYSTYSSGTGEAETKYTSCKISYTKPDGTLIESVKYENGYDEKTDTQQLSLNEKVTSQAEADALAESRLRLYNKFSKTATFTMDIDFKLLGGRTVKLEGWGYWDGKYIISTATHTIQGGGTSTTKITLRPVQQ